MFESISYRDLTSSMGDFWIAAKSAGPWLALCLALLFFAHPLHRITNVIVRRKLDAFTYELVYEGGERAGVPWVQRICNDYFAAGPDWLEAKGFSQGFILDEVTFIDRGSCWSLNPDEQCSWFNRKDANGNYVRKEEEKEKAQGQNAGLTAPPLTH